MVVDCLGRLPPLPQRPPTRQRYLPIGAPGWGFLGGARTRAKTIGVGGRRSWGQKAAPRGGSSTGVWPPKPPRRGKVPGPFGASGGGPGLACGKKSGGGGGRGCHVGKRKKERCGQCSSMGVGWHHMGGKWNRGAPHMFIHISRHVSPPKNYFQTPESISLVFFKNGGTFYRFCGKWPTQSRVKKWGGKNKIGIFLCYPVQAPIVRSGLQLSVLGVGVFKQGLRPAF